MKIIYISDSAIPSASPNSIHVMKMCQAFAALGHEATLIGKKTTACFKNETNIYGRYAVQNNFQLLTYPASAFKGSGIYYNVSLIWRAFFLKADLLYTRSITAAFLLLLYNKPVIFEVHEPYEGKGTRLRKMFSFIVRHKKLTRLVVISAALRKYYIEEMAMDPSKIIIAHDGADEFTSSGKPVIKESGFKIGYVGSLYPGKGMEILIPLAKRCPDVFFHIIGGYEKQIREIKESMGNVPNVYFHGFKTQDELPDYVISFDALIAPYTNRVIVSDKRGANNLALWMSPLKIFEYMSAGKPIITSDLAVIREILVHGENALLCNPDNLNEWVSGITRLKNDPALRESLSKNSLKAFLEHHTWKKRASEILKSIAQQ